MKRIKKRLLALLLVVLQVVSIIPTNSFAQNPPIESVQVVVNVPSGEIPRVLILTEQAASQIEDEEIAWQKTGKFPLIVEVPGLNGHLKGKKTLSDAIKEAVGVEV